MNEKKRIKILITITALIDIIGFGVIIPLLPFYVERFSASPLAITLLMVVYSLCSFLSAPLLGKLSDHFGRKPVLIASIISTAIGWIVFSFANSLWILFLGRIIDGLAAGNITTVASSLGDISENEEERTANMGIIGMLFGIGLIAGPLLGGVLGLISIRFVFLFVGVMALLNALGIFFFMTETNKHISAMKFDYHPLKPLTDAYKNKPMLPVYFVYFLLFVSVYIFNSIFVLYISKVFDFGQTQSALTMTLTGAMIVLNQTFLMKRVWLKRFTPFALRTWPILLSGICMALFSIQSLVVFFIALAIYSSTQSIIRTTLMGYVANKAEPKRRGEAMGILSSVESFSIIVGPLVAGPLYLLGAQIPFIVAGIISTFAFYFSFKKLR